MLKKIIIIVISLFVLLLVAAAAIPLFFKKEINAKIKSSINKNVNAKVDFKELNLSLISSFPNLGIKINNLSIIGIDSFDKDTLANVKQLQLNVNLLSVLKGETYQINSINLEEPKVFAKVLKSGKANWDIRKPDSAQNSNESKPTTFKAALQKYSIEQGTVIYDDASLGFYMKLDSLNHTGKGDFTQDLFTLDTESDIEKLTVKYGGIPYLNGIKLNAELPIEVDMKNMKFTFADNKIKLNELLLSAVGYLAMPNKTDMVMDFKFDAKESELKNFLSLIPSIYAANFKDLEATGKFSMNGVAKGTYNEKSLPAFNLNLNIENGKIKYPSLPSAINNIQIKSQISNPDGVIDNTVINVPSFHLEFGQVPVDGKLLVKNPVSDPFVDMALKGKLDLKQLTAIFPMKDMILNGILDADVKAAGRKSSIDKQQYQAFKASGQIIANNFNYAGKNVPMPISIPSAKLIFSPKNITLSNLSAKVGSSDFAANGSLNNYLSYFFNKNQSLQGNFSMVSNLVNVNELMGPKSTQTTSSKNVNSKLSVFEVPDKINFSIAAKANKVIYDNYDISSANGILLVKDNTITFKDLGMSMLDGRLRMNGTYATLNPKKPRIDVDFGIDKMNIQKAFQAFNTIKLLAPVAKYAKGSFSTDLKYNSDLDENMMPVYSSINAEGLTNIIQAMIDGFEPLNKLASSLSSDKLKKLELNNVITKFKIKDGRLNVAPFDIKKDGIVMNIQGSNGLDQTMDYDLAMNLPRAMLGAKANETVNNMLGKLNNKAGTNVSVGDNVKVNAVLGGTFLKPTINLKYGIADVKSTAKEAINNVIAEKKAELQTKAQAKIDTVKAKATEKVKDVIADKLNNLFKKKNNN
ncbi:AsmA-like C-terminal region-containing protein [Pedobacter aquatilis]|uniref:AsmA-like C-terminal region-containing protein n=1 Tax=Pedobacter aquatilis TaxID=351343 RepID=UPI0025B3F33E|nr:AsmA-like C-terminal region-containing protein [Pedobacter aquatilis]MDN3587347.1 AsmA-like C-terminal region-containing protein [Pedobacter aquatilis]